MRNSPGFESDDSFAEDPPEEEEYAGGGWGVVSHGSGSMGGGATTITTRDGDHGYGVLILDGVESDFSSSRGGGRRQRPGSDLSLPGTDSLPSEIGSLSGPTDVVPDDEEDEDYTDHPGSSSSGGEWGFSDGGSSRRARSAPSWRRHKRNLFLGALCGLLFLAAGLLVKQHRAYKASVVRLEEELLRVMHERDAERAAAAEAEAAKARVLPPPWTEEEEVARDGFTVVDNCWMTAKIDLEWGECGKNARELPGRLWEKLAGALGGVFGGPPLRSGGGNTCDGSRPRNPPNNDQEDLFDAAERALVAAGGLLARRAGEWGEDLLGASAVVASGGAQIAEDTREAARKLSEASRTWKEAMHKTGVSVSHKLHGILEEDPPVV